MIQPVRVFTVTAIAFSLAACSPKKTTVVETDSPATEPATEAANVPTADSENALLATLPPEDKARYEGWFKKYNIAGDPDSMDKDADSDGYSNREEFLADTNPRDPNSLPGVLEGVSVKTLNEVKVPILLREVKGDKARVQRLDNNSEEELTKGSQPKGLPYKVTAMKHEVKADKHGVFTDVSNVTLENSDTKEVVVLIRDLPAKSSETHAVITGPGGAEKKVHLDETVELPGMPGRQFKVLELRGDQVLVEELSTKRALAIPKR
jgi:hypothetical protein